MNLPPVSFQGYIQLSYNMIKVIKMLTKNQYVRIDATLNYLFELLFGYMCLDGKMTLLMNVEH